MKNTINQPVAGYCPKCGELTMHNVVPEPGRGVKLECQRCIALAKTK